MKTRQIIVLLCILSGCSLSQMVPEYKLVTYSGDLQVEQFDSTVTDENRFNHNNKIYTVGASFTYSYQYYNKDDQPRNFRYLEDGWEFTEPKEGDRNEIILGVSSGLKPMIEWIPDYNQTLITYQASNKESFEMTGLIENEANIWMHPPRDGLFRILQLSPYPSVSYPMEKGKKWEWTFKVGSHYGDERWATWDGNITINTSYEITGKEVMKTQWGTLETWTIEAEAVSELGITTMKAVFNDSLGFMEMNFVNIDESELKFKMEGVD